jgi:hypothetical protein
MAVSVSGHEESVLIPTADKDYDETATFEGKISVSNRTIIDYGITQVVSSEAIAELLNQNRRSHRKRLRHRFLTPYTPAMTPRQPMQHPRLPLSHQK